jgi:Protein of unknown function (DUF2829)
MTHHYIGTKEVYAWESDKDGKPGYGVQYEDGYTSWSPKEAFEKAYRISEPGMPQSLTFGDALHYLKQGRKVSRAGWNGKGMWLALSPGHDMVHAGNFYSQANANYAYSQTGRHVKVLPCITMKTNTGEILIGWLASQSDMLAEDWNIVE